MGMTGFDNKLPDYVAGRGFYTVPLVNQAAYAQFDWVTLLSVETNKISLFEKFVNLFKSEDQLACNFA